MKDFSVVLPTYNHVALARQAIVSVLRQRHVSIELIVTDDSDDDAIAQLCGEFQSANIRYFKHQHTGNAVENWNAGLQKAQGKYVVLLHHDEAFVSDDYLYRVKKAFEQQVQVVVTNIQVEAGGRRKNRFLPNLIKHCSLHHPALLFACNTIGACACVAVVRELLPMLDEKLTWLVDVEWYFRLLRHANVVYLPACFVRSQHGHTEQITSNIDIMQALRQDQTAIKQKNYYNRWIGRALGMQCWLQRFKTQKQ